jgi:peptide-methionine (S)-S-oxide reductase
MRNYLSFFSLLLMCCMADTSHARQDNSTISPSGMTMKTNEQQSSFEVATFGAGCFWCVEAVFQDLIGVVSIVSGYSGGIVENPTYEQVCTGTTGHAEVCQITFDPHKITYAELLEVFWNTHDPTTLNRQGADSGTQYRSVIFYHNSIQKELAQKYKQELDKAKIWDKPVVTEISPYKNFFKAETYHQNYYKQNTNQPYCILVIKPKMDKFKKVFKNKVKQ